MNKRSTKNKSVLSLRKPKTVNGIDQLPNGLKQKKWKNKRIGLLCHPSSVDWLGQHILHLLDAQSNVVAIFGPQHGIFGETQDNMIEWQDMKDASGRPIYSLYGKNRKPTIESLSSVDLMVIDLFDVGARYYTFIYTLFYTLERCAELKIPVLICDRPNPLGGAFIEGPILNTQYKSFVGLHPIPVCHGMTIGELAKLFCDFADITPSLETLKLRGWRRRDTFPSTGQRWLLPSPNMPSYETAVLYPGMCLLEGTSLSEGRGTTRPFELIGAPFFNWAEIERVYSEMCKALGLRPVHFHRQGFIPTFHKFAGELCYGAIQIPPAKDFYPLRHATVLLWVLRKLYGNAWNWKSPPYEYEHEKWPIDILAGGPELRECVDQSGSLKNLFKRWAEDEKRFKKQRSRYLLYS